MISTLFFGSIGVLAETSDIQRRAYNVALREAGLRWSWNKDTYQRLLVSSGGKERLRMLADATNADLSDETINKIHARKTEIACEEVIKTKVPLRPGVSELIKFARKNNIKLGLVTGTYRQNIEAIAKAAGNELCLDDFVIVVTKEDVKNSADPSMTGYEYALKKVEALPDQVVAIEDSAVTVLSAFDAGIKVIATPGGLKKDQNFTAASLTVDNLASSEGNLRKDVLDMFQK